MKTTLPRCGLFVLAMCLGLQRADGFQVLDTPVREFKLMPKGHREIPRDAYMPPAPRAAAGFGGPVTVVEGPFISVQVNVDGFGANILDDAANEPSLAIDPTNPQNISVGWRQFDNIASDFRMAGWATSHDGGASWSAGEVHEPGVFRSDPVLAADPDGLIHYFSLRVADWPDISNLDCQMFTSLDGGDTWGAPVPAFGGDKAWIAVDRTNGPGRGHVYAKWQTFFNCCGDSTFIRSIDGGQSFQSRIQVPLGPTFGTLDVGPDGAVYAAGILATNEVGQDPTTLVIARSSNAANALEVPTFEFSTEVDLGGVLVSGTGPNPGGLLGQIQVVTDHSAAATAGNVYMLGSVNPPGGDPMNLHIIRSEDRGENWSAPIRINNDFLNGSAWQWFGTVAVAPTGRIDVVWNDTRESGKANVCALYYAYSYDGGTSWSPNFKASPDFDSHAGWPVQQKMGDYNDMISDEAAGNLIYAATFNGEQDVFFLRLGDCNNNEVHDGLDILDGTSPDVNGDEIPDECQSEVCSTIADCADLDRDGIRDDVCTWWACAASGMCEATDVTIADLGGSFGVCAPDGVADNNDRFHALNCFANVDVTGDPGYPCEANSPAALNVDVVAGFGVCAPDGVCDGNDAFAAINAFEGSLTCACLQGPAPQVDLPPVIAHAEVALRADRRQIRPGGLVAVEVQLDSRVEGLRGYQLHVTTTGHGGGSLDLIDIVMPDGASAVFGEAGADWQAYNLPRGQMVAGLTAQAIDSAAGSTLARFVFRAEREARGRFEINLMHDASDRLQRTFLFTDAPHGRVEIRPCSGLVVDVIKHKR